VSEQKTEQPTEKKKRDSAKKGQIFKSADLTTLVSLLALGFFAYSTINLREVFGLFDYLSGHAFRVQPEEMAKRAFTSFISVSVTLVGMTLLVVPLSTLLQTRFSLASEALKPSFAKLNPVQGLKKLISLRTFKDALKSLCYFAIFAMAVWAFYTSFKHWIFALAQADIESFMRIFGKLVLYLVLYCLGFCLVIVALDALVEYFLVNRDLKMTKKEVKREHEDMNGKPQIKGRRRELALELINEQQKSDVANSNFVLANPTHIAIGIYYEPELCEWPFVSFVASNAVAKALVAHAEKVGTPVVRNIPLARAMYKHVRRYSFVNKEWIEDILRILYWLAEVERAGRNQFLEAEDETVIEQGQIEMDASEENSPPATEEPTPPER